MAQAHCSCLPDGDLRTQERLAAKAPIFAKLRQPTAWQQPSCRGTSRSSSRGAKPKGARNACAWPRRILRAKLALAHTKASARYMHGPAASLVLHCFTCRYVSVHACTYVRLSVYLSSVCQSVRLYVCACMSVCMHAFVCIDEVSIREYAHVYWSTSTAHHVHLAHNMST